MGGGGGVPRRGCMFGVSCRDWLFGLLVGAAPTKAFEVKWGVPRGGGGGVGVCL